MSNVVKLERPDVDWERHAGTGSPKILPPPGVVWRSESGKTKQRHRYYTRVTTYADAISDQYNLMQWKLERVALGLGQRPDYVRLASALTDRDDDRDARRELVAKAIEAAGPNKADEGTALHALTERIDRGEPLGNPPPELMPDLAAYEALSGELFAFVERECRVVCDALEVAGTPDGIAQIAEPPPTDWGPSCDCPPDVLRVIDTKTGSIRYPAKMAIQLAIYSRSDRYDPATGERHPLGGDRPVCPHWGVIVHLPVEAGRAAPYWLDLEAGWRGAELCGPVRAWNAQRADELLAPFRVTMPVVATPDGEVRRGSPMLASSRPSAPTRAPDEATDLTEALAASLAAVTAERVDPGTPRMLEAARLRPASSRDRATEGTLAAVPEPDDPDDDPIAERSTLDPGPDPATLAILEAGSDRDLELVWQRDRAGWRPDHLKLATERFAELKAERDAERPRAAMRAAIETAPTLERLTELMKTWRDEPWMTPELFALADARFWQLKGAPARARS